MAVDRVFRDIKESIEEGGMTVDSLVETFSDRGIDTKNKLFNQIKLINAMGFYPMADEDGVYSMITEEEYDDLAEAAATKKAKPKFTKDPHNRVVSAKNKLDSRLKTTSSAETKCAKSDDVLLKLKAAKADLDYRIAKIELLRLKQKLMKELGVGSLEEFDKIEDLDEYQKGVKGDDSDDSDE